MSAPLPVTGAEWPRNADVRLIAVDMDGTLLDERGQVPETLWPLLERLNERGVVFAPASGRQYATLLREFERSSTGMTFIAENGTLVVRDGEEISSTPLSRDSVTEPVRLLRGLRAEATPPGIVLCGKRSAYIEQADPALLAQAGKYYARLRTVDDVLSVDDEVLKLAVFAAGRAESLLEPVLERFRTDAQVVVSGENWVDVMDIGANKGTALERLQEALGVNREQTAAFGDYFNDAEMLDAAGMSFAMANAHPAIRERARYLAPSNRDHGVVRVLEALLG